MLDGAHETGGRAFVNSNGLKEAVAAAIEDGSNFYTLSYSPANKAVDGHYRKLDVVIGTGRDVALSYRRGYYTEGNLAEASAKPVTEPSEAILTRSMARGAPPATQLQFTARVRLANGLLEPALGGCSNNPALTFTAVLNSAATTEFSAIAGTTCSGQSGGPPHPYTTGFTTPSSAIADAAVTST